jgi:hypothetical protein
MSGHRQTIATITATGADRDRTIGPLGELGAVILSLQAARTAYTLNVILPPSLNQRHPEFAAFAVSASILTRSREPSRTSQSGTAARQHRQTGFRTCVNLPNPTIYTSDSGLTFFYGVNHF